jgi:negative regulator of flagellin synthesis FlgM
MSIEIKGLNNLPIQDPGSSKAQKDKAESAKPNTNASETADDSVNLTNFGRQVSALESKIDKVSEVDHKRVEAIKQAIASGQYEINPERIAKKMLQLESLLPKE